MKIRDMVESFNGYMKEKGKFNPNIPLGVSIYHSFGGDQPPYTEIAAEIRKEQRKRYKKNIGAYSKKHPGEYLLMIDEYIKMLNSKTKEDIPHLVVDKDVKFYKRRENVAKRVKKLEERAKKRGLSVAILSLSQIPFGPELN